ncbi:hypothetical protein ACFSW8_05305 [Rubritalea tangerina]|uniref:Uncharacterized protein n=1 Tax=Rubritalea tangerina TaxID=430798 RepID=A0ABW4Z8K0_9BACT
MNLAQTTSTPFALSDLLGELQMVALCVSMLFSLLFCIIAVTRCNYRFLVTPPILALSMSLLILGITFFNYGVSTYSMGKNHVGKDPSFYLMDMGAMQAGIGANLLSLAVTGGMIFLSYLVIQIRKYKMG